MRREKKDSRLVYNVNEAAERLSISRNLCYMLVRQGVIPSLKLGSRRIVIPKRSLEDFVNSQGESDGAHPK